MFVIQRVLEAEGSFTLLDKNKVLKQNKFLDYLLPQILLVWVIQLDFIMEHNK